ncbi:hypothetical protein Tco_0951851 [Tanacetum coccineum]|uniref:Uncharacterized protein n=1 Tax=Tanacetum coccineum TaxID=301880 RepID=A0ABQ5DVB5_9ASTR
MSQSSLAEQNRNPSSPKRVHFVNSIIILNKENEAKEEGSVKSSATEYKDHEMTVKSKEKFEEETEEETKEEEEDNLEHFDVFPTKKELGYHELLLKNPRPPWVKAKIRTRNLNNDCQVLDNLSLHKLKHYVKCRNEMERGLALMPVIVGVSHDLKDDSRNYSHTGNHPEDDFTPLKTIQRSNSTIGKNILFELEWEAFELERGAKDSIAIQTCELYEEEFNEFLALYHIPPAYHVILPKSNQTIFDASPGYVRLYTHSFSLANLRLHLTEFFCEDEEDLSFLPKEPSPCFSTGSPSMSVNIEPLRADKEPVLQPAEVMTDSGRKPKPELFVVHPGSVAAQMKNRKCKTRGGSSRPSVKRKLASGSSNSHATHAKTSTLKDVVPFLTVSDDDEGLSDIPQLKDATACHL